MELTPSQKETVRHQFDSFCKKVLREEAFDYKQQIARRAEKELPLSSISEKEYIFEDDLSDCISFHVQGYTIQVRNSRLAQTLSSLPEKKRDIVLLFYFLDMNDREISELLNMVRRTVHYMRVSSLKELKQKMEADDGEPKPKEPRI